MTLISSFSKQDQLPTQQPVTIRLKIGKPVPKLSDAMLSYQASEINKLPLEQRIATVQALNIPQELKTKLIQFGIEQKLTKVCDNHEALLATFQEIRALCSVIEEGQDKSSHVPRYFDIYFKPIIQKVAAEKNQEISLSDFHSQDESLKEMLGLWYRCKVTNEHDLNSFYQTQITITKIKVTYAIGAQGAIALADALKENTSLTSLKLWHNQIGDEGAKALAEALKENTSLTSLDLSSNQIGVEGAIALAEALKENTSLTSLNLWDNQIGDQGRRALRAIESSHPGLKIIF